MQIVDPDAATTGLEVCVCTCVYCIMFVRWLAKTITLIEKALAASEGAGDCLQGFEAL